jgi:hypothetical protein
VWKLANDGRRPKHVGLGVPSPARHVK